MMHQKPPTKEEAVARTLVVWDIKSCPVPSGCDARRVGPSIKRALENLGYSGTLTITAIGRLTDVSDDVLRSVSSTGIALWHTPSNLYDIGEAIINWGYDNPPPANILVITARDFSGVIEYLQKDGFNILREFLYDNFPQTFPTSSEVESLWKSFFADTMDSEDKSSETSECDWLCTVCVNDAGDDIAGKGFENFTKHLSSQKHGENMLMFDEEQVEASLDSHSKNANKKPMAPTKEEAVARTLVVWDIKSCPLPSGCDARRVGPSIKRALENLGYSGTLTITAIGHLIGVPHDVLRSVLSTGISLHHIPFDQVNILDAMYQWCKKNPPPANILFITMRNFIGLEFLREKGYNILRQIWYDDPLEAIPTSTDVERLWTSFLTGTMDSEEKSSERSECDWFCAVCIIKAGVDLAGKGFENFTKHISSRKHRENVKDRPLLY